MRDGEGMQFSASSSRTQHTEVLALEGHANSQTAGELERALKSWQEGGLPNLVVDCSGLKLISSAGLRALLDAEREARGSGRCIALAGLRDDVRQVCDLAGFESVFPIYGEASEAVANLEKQG